MAGYALAAAMTALVGAEQTCRYHGVHFDKLGFDRVEPRCDSCKQPWRVRRAIDAIQAEWDRTNAAAAAPVSPAGPHCQNCGHPLRPGEPVHVCHEHRTVVQG